MAKLGLIIIGILIIGAMYTLPVFGFVGIILAIIGLLSTDEQNA